MIQRTFCIIKPDATARHLEDEINEMIIQKGFKIIASKPLDIKVLNSPAESE